MEKVQKSERKKKERKYKHRLKNGKRKKGADETKDRVLS